MDPNTTCTFIIGALHEGWLDEADAHAGSLVDWMYRGGFRPERLLEAAELIADLDGLDGLDDLVHLAELALG